MPNEQAQFETLLEPILASAYGAAYHLTRNRDDAEDLVQEAAIQAFRALGSFQQGTNFKAWFLRILTNLFLSQYRKKRRAPEMVDLQDAPDLYLYTQTQQLGLHNGNSDPVERVFNKLKEEQIANALDSLPEEYRVAATLYFIEELAYQEIADILDTPIGTVRSRLHRSRKMLQKALWEIAEEQGIVAELRAERE